MGLAKSMIIFLRLFNHLINYFYQRYNSGTTSRLVNKKLLSSDYVIFAFTKVSICEGSKNI